MKPLRAPFPWFGGKSRASALVWAAFGDVPNYCEPFFGSGAVLLGRPTPPRVETVNDLDCYVSNFWRALAGGGADQVARYVDWPVNEADLHARHRWLVDQVAFRERMHTDPDYYDAKVAGWWVWGLCQWIGGGWCAASNWDATAHRPAGSQTKGEARRPSLYASNGVLGRRLEVDNMKRPHLWRGGVGVHSSARGALTADARRPRLSGSEGVHRARDIGGASTWRKRPVLAHGGRGVHLSNQIPNLSGDSGATGRGILASAKASRSTAVGEWMRALQDRLRRVRVCCGDWKRVLGRSSTELVGVTGVLLDPPYGTAAGRDPSLYAQESLDVAAKVRQWALEHGDNKRLRIALCGYEGEHEMPEGWQCVAWKAAGGYAASAGNNENSKRERIWFSPHCLRLGAHGPLFDQVSAG